MRRAGSTTRYGLANVLRALALAAILYQVRLLAGDLADTPVFAAALLAAALIPAFLAAVKLRALEGVCVIALVPFVVRVFAAVPRFFVSAGVSEAGIMFDSLLLNFDRNSFVSVLPFYWTAFSVFFTLRSPLKFLRAAVIVDDLVLLVIFCLGKSSMIAYYRLPVVLIVLFALVLFLQFLALLLSVPPEFQAGAKEGGGAVVFALALLAMMGSLLIKPAQEQAVEKGGGLLEPSLFSFDFAPYLRLESEISMNDDLVFIVRKDNDDSHTLMRRFVLSGYADPTPKNPSASFYRDAAVDEAAQPSKLPAHKTVFPCAEQAKAQRTRREDVQEYYLVNLDAQTLLGVNEPVEVALFENWDASSFKSAYRLVSWASDALPFELMDADSIEAGEGGGLSPAELAWYTKTGARDGPIARLARNITTGKEGYWERIEALYRYLKHGEYRYSLKPGLAPDGNQLEYFLFESKKGYCSYFAFAFAAMLRSLDIPCRVAVGFLLDPSEGRMNFYPVRSNLAHAWVEVYFGEYGWIEFDPTTQNLAEGEEFTFSGAFPGDLFERLLKEIMEERRGLRLDEDEAADSDSFSVVDLRERAVQFLRRWRLLLAFLAALFIFAYWKWRFYALAHLCRSNRKKAQYLWRHAAAHLKISPGERPSNEALSPLYEYCQRARFAPAFDRSDFAAMLSIYRALSKNAQRRTSAARVVFLALALSLSRSGQAEEGSADADALYQDALRSLDAENYEQAAAQLSLGQKNYPADARFPLALGDLYYEQTLYNLAWASYRDAERLDSGNSYLLTQLAQTAGLLNRNTASANYLERLLEIEPDDRNAIGSLGWMYFKLHRLAEGAALLSSAIERLGPDADFAMTLATIYSDMYRYEDGKENYLEAVRFAERYLNPEFKAVAYYNLSILESRFFNYDAAYECAAASLAAQNRASGHLAAGELHLRRLDFQAAYTEYGRAYEGDPSPLSKLSMADTFRIAGRLSESIRYTESVLASSSLSWMLNYGIDVEQHKHDMYEVLYEDYAGLAWIEKLSPRVTPLEKAASFFRRLSYIFKAEVNKKRFQKYALLSARNYLNQGAEEHPDALALYVDAFADYPARAAVYLRAARDFECARIPSARASWNYEEGKLFKRAEYLDLALEELDPVWERDAIAESYTELAVCGRSSRVREDSAERLFALNRGALRQRGISLPAAITITAAQDDTAALKVARTLPPLLRRAGFCRPNKTDADARYSLDLHLSRSAEGAMTALCVLRDGGRGVEVFGRRISLPGASSAALAAFVRELAEYTFTEQ